MKDKNGAELRYAELTNKYSCRSVFVRGHLAVSVLIRVHPWLKSLLLSVACLAFVAGICGAAEEGPKAPDGVPYVNQAAADDMQTKALTGNLVANGSFEEGKYWPVGWDPLDKLGTLRVEGGTNGKLCIRMDTNILESQWLPWNEKVLKLAKDAVEKSGGKPDSLPDDPIPAPPAKAPTTAPYYDTVAGNHGIHYRTEFIRLEPGAIYRFSVDARAGPERAGPPMVFLKGFFDERMRTEKGEIVIKRNAFRADMRLYGIGPEWRRFVRIFHPARSQSTAETQPLQPEWFQAQLYAYWPPAVYEFDNVRLEIIGHEEVERKPTPPPKPEEKKPAELKDGEFPVFQK